MKKPLLWLAGILGALVLFMAVYGIVDHFYIVIDGDVYPKRASMLDFSGKPLNEVEKLTRLTRPELLNLRDTGLQPEDYDVLQSTFPDCQILWLVPFGQQLLPPDTRHITVTALSQEEFPHLSYLPLLETVDATACQDYDAILALQDACPQLQVLYQMTLGESVLHQDSTEFASTDPETVLTALTVFPRLTHIDANGTDDPAGIFALQERFPNCVISYDVPLGGIRWSHDTRSITVSDVTAEELSAALALLPDVTSVAVKTPVADPLVLAELVQVYPDISFSYSFRLQEILLTQDTTEVDLSGILLGSVDTLEAYLPLLPALEKVDMCGCGISDEEMSALNSRYPDTLFVWEIQIGHFTLRTDIEYFMPWQYRYTVTDADADKLKYLTELICLDFGHMEISRTDYLAYMPKMQYLMMCCTPITDISPCANMKELKYLELFITNVTDFSPLLECKNLVDLNICYTEPEDPLIFAQMTQLENLWFRGMFDEEIKSALREALPNTKILFGPGSSTGRGWRRLPNYYAQRDIMGMFYIEEP